MGETMPARTRRLVVVGAAFVAAAHPLAAQLPERVDAGAGAGSGGSVFGWQPRVGMNAAVRAASLGYARLDWHGALARVTAPTVAMVEASTGAKLTIGESSMGWWVGGDVIRRSGFKDAVEQPRIETGGWRRLGNVVVTVAAVRRNAALAEMQQITRSTTSFFRFQDSLTGRWDSTEVTRTFHDSARVAELHRWAETEAGLSWDGRRLSAAVAVGARLASRGVPSGTWGSGTLAVRLTSPLSLVVGAGTASGGRFALDGEHRFVTLGFRVRPQFAPAMPDARATPAAATISGLSVDSLGGNRYELSVVAPRARRVEISGDFTNWKPLTLTRAGDGRWTATLALSAGTHRLNARIDGGSWIVPPGLTTMSDDFAGEVGLLVIERRPEDATR
jgi:hypothetical protein